VDLILDALESEIVTDHDETHTYDKALLSLVKKKEKPIKID